jgi:apolipoprotein N-acyltransferase
MSAAVLAAGSGILLALSLAPFDVEWLGWFALVPLLVAARERRPLIALGLGLLTGVVCGVVHVGWHADSHGLQFAYLPFLWLALLLGIVAAAGALFLPAAPGARLQAPGGTLAQRLAAWPTIAPGAWCLELACDGWPSSPASA